MGDSLATLAAYIFVPSTLQLKLWLEGNHALPEFTQQHECGKGMTNFKNKFNPQCLVYPSLHIHDGALFGFSRDIISS
jgi:hypothetical protein